jgi:hypothetical protein
MASDVIGYLLPWSSRTSSSVLDQRSEMTGGRPQLRVRMDSTWDEAAIRHPGCERRVPDGADVRGAQTVSSTLAGEGRIVLASVSHEAASSEAPAANRSQTIRYDVAARRSQLRGACFGRNKHPIPLSGIGADH